MVEHGGLEGETVSALHSPKIYVKVKFNVKGKLVFGKGLVDTGNTVANGVAISGEFFRKLARQGARLSEDVQVGSVSTAQKGAKLRITGRCKPLGLLLQNMKQEYTVKPLVIENLNHEINLGVHFLKKHNLSIKFDSDATRIISTSGEATNLIAGLKGPGRNLELRFQEIWTQLQLEENEVLNSKPKVKEGVRELVKEFVDIFASEAEPFGHTTREKITIKLKEGTKPFKSRVRPLNPQMKKALKDQVDKWMAEGIIRPSRSPWGSPVVLVLKKTGDIRVCVDYRVLNSYTESDAYPLPRISETLEQLSGKRIFSTIDAAAAYHCLEVAEESVPLTAFVTPFGLYEFLRMPFGLHGAVPAYSRFIGGTLEDSGTEDSQAYLDDVLTGTVDEETHLAELGRMFKLHQDNGIKINAKKTDLFRKKVVYLGHQVSEQGIEMVDSYVEKIVNWPVPKTIKELNSLLGFFGYYQRFIVDYSMLTAEMNAQRKKTQLEWTRDMDRKFKILKGEFKKAPIRAYPRYDGVEPFQLTTDFSKENVAAILSQVQEGQERLIAACGRKTTTFEANYGSVKGEVCAIIFGLRKFSHILRGNQFIINTDSAAMKSWRSMKTTPGIFTRWLEELSGYDFVVKHRAGKLNRNADALSRSEHLEPATKEEEFEEAEYICRFNEASELDRPKLLAAQHKDPVLNLVRKWIKEEKRPSLNEVRGMSEEVHRYRLELPGLRIEPDGLLTYPYGINEESMQRVRALVPRRLKGEVFKYTHEHPSAGHWGSLATVRRAKLYFFWPGMANDLREMVKNCTRCVAKDQKTNTHSGVHHPNRSSYPMEKLSIDLVGPLPEASGGYKYLLTTEDVFTRYVTATPIRNKEAVTVAKALMDNYVCVYGCPEQIISDNGKEFANEIFTQLLQEMRIRKSMTPVYNAQSSKVERFHRSVNQYLRVYLDKEDPGWLKLIPALCLAYNTKVHESTQVTPFKAFFGREARVPIDVIVELPQQEKMTMNQHVRDMKSRLQVMYKVMRSNEETVIKRNSRLYEGKVLKVPIDGLVWWYCPRLAPGKPGKLQSKWLGPYRLVEKISATLMRIKPAHTVGEVITVHASRLKPYHGNEYGRVPAKVDFDDEGDEEAEVIRAPHMAEPISLAVPVVVTQPEAEILDRSEVIQDPLQGEVVRGSGTGVTDELDEEREVQIDSREDSDSDVPMAAVDPTGSGSGGVIDGDYTGPVAALVLNLNKETFRVSKGQRIAQGLFLPVCSVQFKNVDQLPSTDRGDAGFGSTDQNH